MSYQKRNTVQPTGYSNRKNGTLNVEIVHSRVRPNTIASIKPTHQKIHQDIDEEINIIMKTIIKYNIMKNAPDNNNLLKNIRHFLRDQQFRKRIKKILNKYESFVKENYRQLIQNKDNVENEIKNSYKNVANAFFIHKKVLL